MREIDLFLDDILDRSNRIQKLIEGRSLTDFQSEDALHEALLRHLTIIGEAVKNLPSDLLDLEPEIPWRKIARLRDLLVHVYFGVKDEVIWNILMEDIQPMSDAIQRLRKRS